MTQAGLGKSFAPAYVMAKLPPLRSTDGTTPLDDKPLLAKWFSPYSGWTWWAAEYDPDTRTCWGFVQGFEGEWGPFSLDELESLRATPERDGRKMRLRVDPNGKLPLVERDHYFEPTTLAQLRASGAVAA